MEIIHIYPRKYNFLSEKQHMELLLLHLAMQDSSYELFFRYNNNYKILDNSFYELRKPVSYETMIEYGKRMRINEIIMPDKLQDGSWTRKHTKKVLDEYYNIFKNEGWKVAGVVQGKNLKDIKKTIDYFGSDKRINVLMLPRKMLFDNSWFEGRLLIWYTFKDLFKVYNKPIHLLGANSWADFFVFGGIGSKNKIIRSIDTKLLVKTVIDDKWKYWRDNIRYNKNLINKCNLLFDLIKNKKEKFV